MQLERAARALPFRVKTLLQYGAAIRAARARNRANHARRSRPDLLLPGMTFVVRTFFFFLGLVGTLVAPMLILPVQGNLRGDAQSYSESEHASRILSEAVDIPNHQKSLVAAQNNSRAAAYDPRTHKRANPSARKSGCKNFRGVPASERIASAAK
jgi:hypothetical protein